MRWLAALLLSGSLVIACSRGSDSAPEPETVYAESPPVWFEAHRVLATIAPNARLAALPLRWPLSVRLVDLGRRAEAALSVAAIVDSARNATFMQMESPSCSVGVGGIRVAYRGNDASSGSHPPNAMPLCPRMRANCVFVPHAAASSRSTLHAFASIAHVVSLDGRVTACWLPGSALL